MAPTNQQGATPQGAIALDQAIAILGQLNILIPIGYTLGKSLVELVKSAIDRGNVPQATVEEARMAVAAFSQSSTEVRETAETWLDTHPAEDEG